MPLFVSETRGTEPKAVDRPNLRIPPKTNQTQRNPTDTDSDPDNRLMHGRASPAESDRPNGFDLFWAAYPKKVKKQDAIKAWGQVKADGLTDTIMDALTQFGASPEWSRENGRYIPHPASWLRGRRWEDEFLKGGIAHGTDEPDATRRDIELTGFKDAYDDLHLGDRE